MVTLDDRSIAGAGFNDVGVDGALHQVVHLAQLFGLVLEDPDELLANDLPLGLRVGNSGQLSQESGLCIHPGKMNVPPGKGGFHLVSLVLTHQPWSTKTQVN